MLLLLLLQEIQQLPYQHIVKWLPSGLRSKDPGPADCLDVQVETTAGKKDLRMRCADEGTVQTVISDIRTTVQVCVDWVDCVVATWGVAGVCGGWLAWGLTNPLPVSVCGGQPAIASIP